MREYEIHEFCNLFPPMDNSDFQQLVNSIRELGLLEPITLLGDKILDGKNRYKACKKIGIKPRFVQLKENINPLEFVITKNINKYNEFCKADILLDYIEKGYWRFNEIWEKLNDKQTNLLKYF